MHRDTDEGGARPSVWPVYVTSGIMVMFGAVGLYMCFMMVLELPTISPEETWTHVFLVVYMGLYGAFGLVTAIGTSLLRPWAWRLATIFGGLLGLSGFGFLFVRVYDTLLTSEKFFLELDEVLDKTLVPLALGAFIVWVLETRRQLFFPRKQDDGE